jgi:hypothetical protein
MRRGVEGTIALTQSHGENVDWLKVILLMLDTRKK